MSIFFFNFLWHEITQASGFNSGIELKLYLYFNKWIPQNGTGMHGLLITQRTIGVELLVLLRF